MAGENESLRERALQFHTLKLPGQPQMMHMGTSSLVFDLERRIVELETKNNKLTSDLAAARWAREHRGGGPEKR